jgi:hypothetical protein
MFKSKLHAMYEEKKASDQKVKDAWDRGER